VGVKCEEKKSYPPLSPFQKGDFFPLFGKEGIGRNFSSNKR
jgi:hypothetical protein